QLARAQEQLHESQRLEAIGHLAGGVAHDFNNVLTVITGLGDLIKAHLPRDHPGQADIELMRDAASQGTDLTRKLLAFGRRQVLDFQVLDLNEVVRRFRSILGRLLPETIDVRLRLTEPVGAVRADRSQLEQVLLNLAVNARDAMPEGGHLTIETMDAELDAAAAVLRPDVQPGRYVALVVSDTGVGMDEATRQRIFEPFFTTKPAGKGTGLGLATVYGIVKQSGGHIWVYSEPSHGATFKIYFPRVDEPVTAEHPQPAQPAAALTGTETVLLVEDDDQVREVTRRILVEYGYRVLPTGRPERALDILTREAGPVHLLLSDVVLPGMSGPQLARAAQARRPGLRVLYQSGYSEEAVDEHGLLGANARLVPKPFSASTLLTAVRETLGGPAAG
ncbi:MAG: ATP-binding protein, partial [Gemmatimonadales bacterium]